MQYPILFSYGEDGFHLGIKNHSCSSRSKIKRGNVTAREYYSYIVQQCFEQGLTLLKGGKIFHQYLVDTFTSIEGMKLEYIYKKKKNQRKIRDEVYQGVVDNLHRGDMDASNLGKRIIFPASFTAGPRYLLQNYTDAIAICKHYGTQSGLRS